MEIIILNYLYSIKRGGVILLWPKFWKQFGEFVFTNNATL